MHEEIEDSNLFYCFVHINSPRVALSTHTFRFFVVPSAIVANYVRQEHQAWLDAKSTRKRSDRRTFRIGLLNDCEIRVPAPLASLYEDKWELVASPAVSLTPDENESPDS
jgi:hypothetical protein